MVNQIINLMWGWIGSNIKLPFNKEKVVETAVQIGYDQGLPAVVASFERMCPPEHKDKLNHPMWQSAKQLAECNDASKFVKEAATMLKNSGQADEIMKTLKQS